MDSFGCWVVRASESSWSGLIFLITSFVGYCSSGIGTEGPLLPTPVTKGLRRSIDVRIIYLVDVGREITARLGWL